MLPEGEGRREDPLKARDLNGWVARGRDQSGVKQSVGVLSPSRRRCKGDASCNDEDDIEESAYERVHCNKNRRRRESDERRMVEAIHTLWRD